MTYMIKISQTGDPKLVKVPEKPNPDLEKYVGDSMLWDEDWEEYKQALASALADEDKHIVFKDKAQAFKIISDSNKGTLAQFAVASGQSFPLPTGWDVKIEEFWFVESQQQWRKVSGERKENRNALPHKKMMAVLIHPSNSEHEQEEMKEPKKLKSK